MNQSNKRRPHAHAEIQKTLDEAIFVYPNSLSREWPKPIMLLKIGGMAATCSRPHNVLLDYFEFGFIPALDGGDFAQIDQILLKITKGFWLAMV